MKILEAKAEYIKANIEAAKQDLSERLANGELTKQEAKDNMEKSLLDDEKAVADYKALVNLKAMPEYKQIFTEGMFGEFFRQQTMLIGTRNPNVAEGSLRNVNGMNWLREHLGTLESFLETSVLQTEVTKAVLADIDHL